MAKGEIRMPQLKKVFTSESVTEGHPDKIADQIADAVLDECLTQDLYSRVACEVFVNVGLVLVAGQIATKGYINVDQLVRQVVKDIGYTQPDYGFDYQTCAVLASIIEQSADISLGVTKESKDQFGAGDQGMMSGYATNETPEYMPTPILLAHRLARKLAETRKDGTLPYLRPDGKTQVTVEYQNGKPKRLDSVVISCQHDPGVSLVNLQKDIKQTVIQPICNELLDRKTRMYINNTGRFVIGGPMADSGMTGRKNVSDTYGGVCGHGGGAFSGKDPTKVDRSASYGSRWVAKNVVAAGLAERCEIQIAYVIAGTEPLSVWINTYGTNKVPEEKILEIIMNVFDLSPAGLIKQLDLLRPIYRKTSSYGHFGRTDEAFPWETLNKVDDLKG
jgi:S-adenosylmethionine synthetase